tara:strand:+ start:231 stop:1112 length:882 start_codon:yes stop_codon:yes gene_type:complete
MKNQNDNKNVTIVIVLYKEPYELISKTLNFIKDFKIIIIDNDNNDELKNEILKNFKIYRYILNKKNNGFSAGYNQGIRESLSSYTLVLGPDCLIKSDDIYTLTKKLSSYEDALIVTPTSFNHDQTPSYSGGPLPENGQKDIILTLDGDACVESALGACMMFKTEDFKKNNLLFDENFFLYFSDDDLCRTIKFMKKSVIQIKDSICIHQHGNIKVKNKYMKIYIREYNFTHDMLYYFYKKKTNNYFEMIRNFKKKIPNYIIKFIFKFLTFQYSDAVKIYSRISAFNVFKSKFLN